jgi:hypothetical protein
MRLTIALHAARLRHASLGFLILGAALAHSPPVRADAFGDSVTAFIAGNYETAFKIAQPLADQGDARAQDLLGEMYEDGAGVAQDYGEALKWYRLSARQGNSWAHVDLGKMYSNGIGTPQDIVRAYMWFDVGSTSSTEINDIQSATEKRAIVGKALTPTQLTQAQAQAKICRGTNYKSCGESDERMIDKIRGWIVGHWPSR